MKSINEQRVLISGASMAGLAAAHKMNMLGYKVTVIELAAEPRIAGGAVNIEGIALEDTKHMGIFESLKANRLNVELIEFKNNEDVTEGSMIISHEGDELPDTDIEIEREKYVSILMDKLQGNVEFIFNNSILAMQEDPNAMHVTFKDGSSRDFEIVLGCDGIHSGVRRLWFGPEEKYTHFLGGYFSITIVNKLLVKQKTMQMYGEPDKAVMLNAYNNKTDIIFCFNSENEIPYDYRNVAEQRSIINDKFATVGWRAAELLEEVKNAPNFYFDKFCQVKMPSWSKGRVALIGDAAYCASPAAGKGASLALHGAAVLADMLQKHDGNFTKAFSDYNNELRPYIEEVQTDAASNVRDMILKTEDAIRERNKKGFIF